MTKNVGNIDKIIRLVLGLAIIIAGFIFETWFGLLGIIPLFTVVSGFCPLYTLFGISTCKLKE